MSASKLENRSSKFAGRGGRQSAKFGFRVSWFGVIRKDFSVAATLRFAQRSCVSELRWRLRRTRRTTARQDTAAGRSKPRPYKGGNAGRWLV
jgi:hypothetical protein